MFRWGSGGSAFTAGRIIPTQGRCLLLRKDFLGPVHVATKPRPPGLVFYELRPAKGHLQTVSL